jgi:hypothetical protein
MIPKICAGWREVWRVALLLVRASTLVLISESTPDTLALLDKTSTKFRPLLQAGTNDFSRGFFDAQLGIYRSSLARFCNPDHRRKRLPTKPALLAHLPISSSFPHLRYRRQTTFHQRHHQQRRQTRHSISKQLLQSSKTPSS